MATKLRRHFTRALSASVIFSLGLSACTGERPEREDEVDAFSAPRPVTSNPDSSLSAEEESETDLTPQDAAESRQSETRPDGTENVEAR